MALHTGTLAAFTRKRRSMSIEAGVPRHPGEQGITLVETMIATLVTTVGVSAVLGLFAAGMVHNHTEGDVASRVTTFCQAKMEELSALQFADGTSNTTVWPPTSTGTGLCGALAANSSCGSVDPASPLASYVDYLDFQGQRVASADQAAFMRQWSIATDSTGNLKTITVRTTATRTLAPRIAPFTVLSSQKSRP